MFTQILVIACHAMLNPARDSTRFVARLSFSTVIGRGKKGHGGRACRLALSGRIGSSLDIPSIQLSRITRGFYLSPHYYWQEKRHFLNQNEKIFFFSLAGGLCPSLLLAKKSAFLQPKQKNNFIFLRFAVFGVLTSCSCFSLPYFPHPPA